MANICTNCGVELREGSKFCTTCGTPVTEVVVSEENAVKKVVETIEVNEENIVQKECVEPNTPVDMPSDEVVQPVVQAQPIQTQPVMESLPIMEAPQMQPQQPQMQQQPQMHQQPQNQQQSYQGMPQQQPVEQQPPVPKPIQFPADEVVTEGFLVYKKSGLNNKIPYFVAITPYRLIFIKVSIEKYTDFIKIATDDIGTVMSNLQKQVIASQNSKILLKNHYMSMDVNSLMQTSTENYFVPSNSISKIKLSFCNFIYNPEGELKRYIGKLYIKTSEAKFKFITFEEDVESRIHVTLDSYYAKRYKGKTKKKKNKYYSGKI